MTLARKILLLSVMITLLPALALAQGGRIQDIVFRSGIGIGGVNVAVCAPLATTAAVVSGNLVTFTMSSNPVTAGFAQGGTIWTAGFTGGDTYLNVGTFTGTGISGGLTILSVTPTTIVATLVHANASAGSNGTILQMGTTTIPCGGKVTLYTDSTLSVPSVNPVLSDGYGNFGYWVSPGQYYYQMYGPTVATTLRAVTVASIVNSSIAGGSGAVLYNNNGSLGGTGGIFTNGSNLKICGPVPWRDVTCFGAFSSTQSFTATTVSGSPIVTLNTPGDWINSTASLPSYISIEGAGPLATVLAPDITPVAITAIARNDGVYGGSVEQITVAGGITNGPFFFTASQFVNITGVTNSAFNANLTSNFNCNTSDSTHICVYPATVADGTSSSGGFINPAMAFYEGIHPGSTTHTYRVASIDDNGGVSAKSAPLTITNDPATLDEQNTNWIDWGFKIPVTSGHINGYCQYKDGAFLKDIYEPGFFDDGNTQWSRPDVCPATEPATPTHQTLTCEVLAGAGTTTLTLVQLDGITPCNASVSTSGLFTFHDSVPAVNAAEAAAKADNTATHGGGPEVIVPSGQYWYSRLNVDNYTLDMWGAPQLTGYPMTINNAGTINGHGQTTFNGGQYNQDRLNIPASNEGDAFLIQGFSGTVRGFQSEVRCGHDFVVPVGSGVVIENFNAIHQACGDCGLVGGNSFFFHINNFNCSAAHIAAGASYNRAGIYFSNRSAANNGPWVEIHFRDLFCSFGCIHVDSPAPAAISANFQNSDIYNLEMEGDVNPANDTKGVIVIHAGCQVSPHNIRANVVGLFVYHPTISDPVLPLIYDDDYLDPACRNLWGTFGNNVAMGGNVGPFSFGGDGIQGIGTDSTIIGAGTGDTGLPSGGTEIGGGDGGNIWGGPSFCNFKNTGGFDAAGCGYLLPPPDLVPDVRGVGGSCGAHITKYFQLQESDPEGGWTRVYTEAVTTTNNANELPGIVYGTTLAAGFIHPPYRIWVGDTSGVENRYFETTDKSQFTYDCNDGVTIYHGAAVFGTPPTRGNAYQVRFASQSGLVGSNVNRLLMPGDYLSIPALVSAEGNKLLLPSDFTDTTNATLQLIPGLSKTLQVNEAHTYTFHCSLQFNQTTAADTDSFGVGVTGLAPTSLSASGLVSTSASVTASGNVAGISSITPTAVVTFTPSAITTVWTATLDGTIVQPANVTAGVFGVYVSTTTGADNIVVKKNGSYCSLF